MTAKVAEKQMTLPMDLGPPTLEEIKARGVAYYHGFNQEEIWIDQEGRVWDIPEMKSSHLSNVLTYLLKHAEWFFFYYGFGDAIVGAEAKEKHDIPLVVEEFSEGREWIQQTDLFTAIEREIESRHEGVSFGVVVEEV